MSEGEGMDTASVLPDPAVISVFWTCLFHFLEKSWPNG